MCQTFPVHTDFKMMHSQASHCFKTKPTGWGPHGNTVLNSLFKRRKDGKFISWLIPVSFLHWSIWQRVNSFTIQGLLSRPFRKPLGQPEPLVVQPCPVTCVDSSLTRWWCTSGLCAKTFFFLIFYSCIWQRKEEYKQGEWKVEGEAKLLEALEAKLS